MSTYTYNTFLNQYTDTDSTLQIVDTDGVIKFTINPYSILTTMISNNLLTFKIKSGRLISIPFSTMNESKIALILAEERIQLLINKTPNFIDKQVEKYVYINGGVTGSTGATGLGATGATGATGPAVNISGTPLNIPMFDLSGSSLTSSIISQGDGYVEIDSLTMSTSGLKFKNLKSIGLPRKSLTLDEEGNVIFHDEIILTPDNFKTINGQSIVGTGNIDTTLINPDNILPTSQIVDLVQNNGLVPGNYYMINDYQTIYTINGSNSAPLLINKKISSYVASTWAMLEGGYDYNLVVGTVVKITKLPVGYSGPLVVGATTTITVESFLYYFRFANGMENVINLEFSYDIPRFSNGIANNIVVNDANGKPVIKPGGVLNTEVHNGTTYMDMTALQNLSVPVESLILRAKSTNEFELEGKSATYAGDIIEFKLPEPGSVSVKGTILRRYNRLLNIDIKADWRVQRYRRWKIDDASILKVLNKDQTTSTVTFNAGVAQFTSVNALPENTNLFYIASTLDSKEMTLDINGKVIEFTMTVENQASAKDLPIFPLLSNHYPDNIEKIIISGNFENTVIQNNPSEVNFKTFINVSELVNTTFVSSVSIEGTFFKIEKCLFLDTISTSTIAAVKFEQVKSLAMLFISDGTGSSLTKTIIGTTTSDYGGGTLNESRWIYLLELTCSHLDEVAIGGALVQFIFNSTRINDSTLYFHTTLLSSAIGNLYDDSRLMFYHSYIRNKTILNRAKTSNVKIEIQCNIANVMDAIVRDVYINTTNYTEIEIQMNKFTKELYYMELNALNVVSVNTFATKQP